MRILVVAPHADDETLGMGGTIAKYSDDGHDVIVAVLTGPGDQNVHPLGSVNIWTTVRSELRQACKILGVNEILFENIPAIGVADQPIWKINEITRNIVSDVRPDVIFLPFLNDLYKDHRECFHSFSVTWRAHTEIGRDIKSVYCYEVPSETHLNFPYVEQGFLPNTWSDVSKFIHRKIEALKCYKSQLQEGPSARSVEAVEALAVWRGSQIRAAAAEAFVLVRRIMD